MKRRVVVTGLGCVTPVGNDVGSSWQALLDGKSGGALITHFDASGLKVKFACEVKAFDPALYMDRKEVKRSDRYTHYAMAAAVQAMADAGLAEGKGFVPDRCGVIIGSGIGGINTFEAQHHVLETEGAGRISP
ncbi:MAG: beta-ketoacyl synthase N-terminal-like domain-containing protein, partial [Gemmatimonadota bacterium]